MWLVNDLFMFMILTKLRGNTHDKMVLTLILFLGKVLLVCCISPEELTISEVITSFMEDVSSAAQLQEHFDQLPKEIITVNATKYVDSFANKLEEKTNLSKKVLTNLRDKLIRQYTDSRDWIKRQRYSCCNYPRSKLNISVLWKNWIDENNVCDIRSESAGETQKESNDMLKLLKDAYKEMSYKSHHVFFGDDETGTYIQYPAMRNALDHDSCRSYDPRLRSWYTGALTPRKGKIVVIVAHFKHQEFLEKQKKVLKTILDTIGAKDKVVLMVIGKHSTILYPNTDCLTKLVTATPIIIEELKRFIDRQESTNSIMNTVKSFEEAFKHFENETISKKKVIVFVTSSEDPTLSNNKDDILNSITKANNQFSSGNGLIFLIAVHSDLSGSALRSYGLIVSQGKGLGEFIWSKVPDYLVIKKTMFKLTVDKRNEIYFTLPHFDINGLGRMIDACIPLYDENNEKFYGVACIAFLSEELLNIENEPEFEESLDSYAFLVDEQGITYMHPKYEEPILETDKPFPVNIRKLETAKAFDEIYESMVNQKGISGTQRISVNVSTPRGDVVGGSKRMLKEYTYSWKKIASSSFWLTVVVSSLSTQRMKLKNQTNHNQTTTYHRFNLPFWRLCKIANGYAVRDSSTITLVRDLYMQPSVFYKQQNPADMKNLMDYFDYKKDYVGKILRDPATARLLRNYISGSAILDNLWKSHSFKRDIIWVYFGLSNGLFRIFPGNNMHIDYDPRIRPWYRLALHSPEEYALTSPYEGFTSKLAMITMAKRIHMSHNSNQIVGVIGVDLNVTWLTKHVLNIKSCNQPGHSCMILDKSGSVVYHESFNKNVDYKKLHITQKEPHLSRHLLMKGHMVKEHCVGYHKVTLKQTETKAHYQWFYKLDHINSTISEMDGGKSCVRYTITPIRRTNLLLINLQSTCTMDYPCLCNLNKESVPVCQKSFSNGDLIQCECPCYDFYECTIDVPSDPTLLCQPPNFSLNVKVHDYHNWQTFDQNKCHVPDCQTETNSVCNPSSSSKLCNGNGCQWCHKHINGRSLSDPFCSDNRTCAGGLLESCEKTIVVANESDENQTVKISLVSVAVTLLIVILLLGILYHWRNYLKKSFGIESTPNAPVYEMPPTPAQIMQSRINDAYLEVFEPGVDDYIPSNIPKVGNPPENLNDSTLSRIPVVNNPPEILELDVSEYGDSNFSV